MSFPASSNRIWLAVVTSVALSCAPGRSAAVDDIVKPFLAPNLGGVAVAVIDHGTVVIRKGFGLANLEKRLPVTPQTVFDLASLSKQFTGIAVLMLAHRGRFSMQDDVRKYLPEVPPFDRVRPIRVEDLSRHRSGLPDFDGSQPPRTDADALGWIAQQTSLEFPPGSRWEYRNVNYFLLARIVERVSGKTFHDYLEEEVFRPAGMAQAQVMEAAKPLILSRAVGYCFGKPCEADPGPTGAGGVFASLDDLVAWDAALARGTLVDSAVLVSALDAGYAFGWGVAEHDGHRLMWHDGDTVGSSTYIARYLDARLTIIVLSNQTRQEVGKLERRLAAAFLPVRK
jgi:CubicO group peptidase (beta-lactamase class C family)